MSTFRVYIKVFDSSGAYKADFEEITSDVIKLGSIAQQLDNSEYDLGIFRNGGFNITLRNNQSRYSNVDNVRSIFRFKRAGAQVKVTWDIRDNDLICGFFNCGEELVGEEVIIYEGLLSDVVSTSTIDDQTIDFKIQGFESLFDNDDVPFSLLSNGDLISLVLFDCLNQSSITNLITVSALNILPNIDIPVDLVADLENKTVKEALNELLLISNSVLFIKDRIVYVKSRSPSVDLEYTFHGQASIRGIESVVDIRKYRDGLNRTFNFVTWGDNTQLSRDLTSISRNGVLKKEVKSSLISVSSTANIQSSIDSLKTEFAYPKTEMDLETPMNYDTLNLSLLDKVNIDYPTIYVASDNNPVPRYGQDRYGQARYPFGQWSLTIDESTKFKILSKKIDTVKQSIIFGLRRI